MALFFLWVGRPPTSRRTSSNQQQLRSSETSDRTGTGANPLACVRRTESRFAFVPFRSSNEWFVGAFLSLWSWRWSSSPDCFLVSGSVSQSGTIMGRKRR